MKLNKLLSALNFPGSSEWWADGWDEAQEKFPGHDVTLPWLTEAFLREQCQRLKVPLYLQEKIIESGKEINGSPALKAIAWYCRYSLFVRPDYPQSKLREWPTVAILDQVMEKPGMFYLVVLLSGFESLQKKVRGIGRERSIPGRIIDDTVTDITSDLPTYIKEAGGFNPGSLQFRVYTNFGGEYFRLGRLAFNFAPFPGRIRVFRNLHNGTTTALAEDGLRFMMNGQLYSESRLTPAAEAGIWYSELTVNEKEICGHPIHPEGRAMKSKIRLPARHWRQVLAPRETMIYVHIPTGPGMDHGECGKSMVAARDFFPRYFPEKEATAFASVSWLFDRQLQQYLPADSNIVKFQREFFLFPHLSEDREIIHKVFGCNWKNFSEAPRDTALQKTLYQQITAGRQPSVQAGGAFLLFADLKWGKQAGRPDWNCCHYTGEIGV